MDIGQFFQLMYKYCCETMCKVPLVKFVPFGYMCAKWDPKLWMLSEKSKNSDKKWPKSEQAKSEQPKSKQPKSEQPKSEQSKFPQTTMSSMELFFVDFLKVALAEIESLIWGVLILSTATLCTNLVFKSKLVMLWQELVANNCYSVENCFGVGLGSKSNFEIILIKSTFCDHCSQLILLQNDKVHTEAIILVFK